MTATQTTIPTEITDATDAELAAWTKALNAGTMFCAADYGRAIFAEVKRRSAAAAAPDCKDLYALHTFCGVGYEIIVGMDQDAADTFWIFYAGAAKPLEGFGPYGNQAQAIADAANLVLGDLSAETGIPQGSIKAEA